MNFKELNLIEPIQKALTDVSYMEPTEIQQKAIPHILKSRFIRMCTNRYRKDKQQNTVITQ